MVFAVLKFKYIISEKLIYDQSKKLLKTNGPEWIAAC